MTITSELLNQIPLPPELFESTPEPVPVFITQDMTKNQLILVTSAPPRYPAAVQ